MARVRDDDRAEIETLDEALFDVAHLIAGLAAADGAVVMSKHNELLGFGGMISDRLPDVERVCRALDLEGERVVEEETGNVWGPPPLGLPAGQRAARIGGGRGLPRRGRALRVPERRPRHLLGARVNQPSDLMKLPSPVTAFGQRGMESWPGRLGVSELTRP